MRQDQIEALDVLEKAAQRLEKARKEIGEAVQDHTRAIQRAHRTCPHLFSHPSEEDES